MKKLNFNIDQLDIDNEGDFSLSKQQYKSKSMKQEYIENNFVDFGLPSGNLWGAYNLGVDLNKNMLINNENWFGSLYAWGETKPKETYRNETYIFENDGYMTKYNMIDGLTQLLPKDDAASVYYKNPKICIPSVDDFQELIQYSSIEWLKNYKKIKNLNGLLFTSKINGNTIFLPAAGTCSEKTRMLNNFFGYYYTSNVMQEKPHEAYHIAFSRKESWEPEARCELYTNYRWIGKSIRPIKKQ